MKMKDEINNISPRFVTTDASFWGTTDYVQWVSEIKKRYQASQIKSRVQVNSTMLEFYWSLGHDIILLKAEQRWGTGVLDKLSKDLKDAFPNEKYSHFIGDYNFPYVLGLVPWGHHTKRVAIDFCVKVSTISANGR